MNTYPTLNLPQCSLTTRQVEGRIEVFDIARKRYVALTPEEWVRQHVVHALHFHQGYPLEIIQVEGAISLAGLTKRCDVVVYNCHTQAIMIVECKKTDVPLTQKVLEQICRYNQVLHVPYLYVTNGLKHIVCKADFDHQCLLSLSALPTWEELKKHN